MSQNQKQKINRLEKLAQKRGKWGSGYPLLIFLQRVGERLHLVGPRNELGQEVNLSDLEAGADSDAPGLVLIRPDPATVEADQPLLKALQGRETASEGTFKPVLRRGVRQLDITPTGHLVGPAIQHPAHQGRELRDGSRRLKCYFRGAPGHEYPETAVLERGSPYLQFEGADGSRYIRQYGTPRGARRAFAQLPHDPRATEVVDRNRQLNAELSQWQNKQLRDFTEGPRMRWPTPIGKDEDGRRVKIW